MGQKPLILNRLEFGGSADSGGDVEIEVEDVSGDVSSFFIDRDDAILLIEHLNRVFNI